MHQKLKGIVHPKKKITLDLLTLKPSYSRYIWLSSFRQIQSEFYLKNVQTLPSFIMEVGSGPDFEAK